MPWAAACPAVPPPAPSGCLGHSLDTQAGPQKTTQFSEKFLLGNNFKPTVKLAEQNHVAHAHQSFAQIHVLLRASLLISCLFFLSRLGGTHRGYSSQISRVCLRGQGTASNFSNCSIDAELQSTNNALPTLPSNLGPVQEQGLQLAALSPYSPFLWNILTASVFSDIDVF